MTSGHYNGKTALVKTGNARYFFRIIQSSGFHCFFTRPVKKSSRKKPVGKARTHISRKHHTTNSASSMPAMNAGAGITMETAKPSMISRGNQYLHLVHMFRL